MSSNGPGNVWRAVGVSVAIISTAGSAAQAPPPPAPAPASQTQIVLLGTGNPVPDPDRSGPATAVVVNGTPYLVDFGAGVMRRAKAAVVDKGIAALEPPSFRVAFVTHLHSDHTIGYPDLLLTPWTYGRRVPLEVYGPHGIKAMSEHLLEAYRADFEARRRSMAGASTPWDRIPKAMESTRTRSAPASSTRTPTSPSPRSRQNT